MDQPEQGPAVAPHDNINHASGANIFWCLMALAFSCMVQQSFIDCVWGNGSFKDTIWPQRSSPLFCLLDSAVEIFGTVRLFYSRDGPWGNGEDASQNTNFEGTDSEEGDQDRAKSIAVTMRLTVFLVSVVPQAIQLFSMRGILLTQLIAAAFCVSATTSTVCSLRKTSTANKILEEARRLRELPVLRTKKRHPQGLFNVLTILLTVVHMGLLLSFCLVVLKRGRPFDIPEDSYLKMLSSSATIGFNAIGPLALVRSVYDITAKVPSALFGYLAIYTPLDETVTILDVKYQATYGPNILNATRMLLWYSLTCLFVSWVLGICANCFFGRKGIESSEPGDGDLEASSASDTATLQCQSIDIRDTGMELHELTANHSAADSSTAPASSPRASSGLQCSTCSDPIHSQTLPTTRTGRHQSLERNNDDARSPRNPGSLASVVRSAWKSTLDWIAAESAPGVFRRYPSRRKPFRHAVLLFFGYFRALYEVQVYCWWSAWMGVRSRSNEEIWIAFGLLNFSTAVIYYLFLFDNEGTTAPKWSEIFG